jgi:hypothetical protein
VTLEIPHTFVNKTCGEYRQSQPSNDGHRLLLGLLTNTGSPNAMKIEALRDAQKTSDVSQLIANMQKVKGLEVNQPVLLPPDDLPADERADREGRDQATTSARRPVPADREDPRESASQDDRRHVDHLRRAGHRARVVASPAEPLRAAAGASLDSP